MKASVGGTFELTPAGQYPARIYSIVDIGRHPDTFNVGKFKNQIIITWELIGSKMEDGRPFVISKFYNLSLSSKSNLYKDLKSMSGKSMTDSQAANFDFTKLIRMPCSIVVANEVKDGKDKAVISALVPANGDVGILQNETIFFDSSSPDWNIFDQVPEWQQNFMSQDIKTAYESKGSATPAPSTPAPENEPQEDDIPW